jgi:glycosyltransferase involved in cell wall biosynthesis
VIPDVTALPCNPFDAKDIAEKIYSLLRDEAKIEEMGTNARDFIQGNYGWDSRAKVYPQIFEILLSEDLDRLNELPLTVDMESSGF